MAKKAVSQTTSERFETRLNTKGSAHFVEDSLNPPAPSTTLKSGYKLYKECMQT